MAKKYIVDLNKDEKAELVALTQKGRPGARKIKRANILLLADTGKPNFEFQKPKRSGSGWIISTPIRPPPFTKLFRLSKRGT